jgi:dTDP-4-dehydrorhamnose 3,5-epimerase
MDEVDIVRPFITELLKIQQSTGSIMHALKSSSKGYYGFGEAYFSTVNFNKTKGWKLHRKMTLNIIVPYGDIRFIVHDGKLGTEKALIEPLIDVVLGVSNFSRLTVPPGYWMAFRGVGKNSNILMNIADIEHDPDESINMDLNHFIVKGFESYE